jgi:non-ribosomal peptide synthetase component F
MTEEDTLENYLTQVKRTVLQSHKHQSYPFEQLLHDIEYKRDLSRSPLFDIMVVMVQQAYAQQQNYESIPVSELLPIRSKMDMTFFLNEREDSIRCEIIYNSDLFEETAIAQLFADLLTLLSTVSEQSTVTLQALIHSILDQQEVQEQSSYWEEVNEIFDEDF